jgi:hypothetical protein
MMKTHPKHLFNKLSPDATVPAAGMNTYAVATIFLCIYIIFSILMLAWCCVSRVVRGGDDAGALLPNQAAVSQTITAVKERNPLIGLRPCQRGTKRSHRPLMTRR